MSFTARERHNPPPRRKSCAACIKAKRRCDFAFPACLRCSQRRIQCLYPGRTLRDQGLSPQTPQVSHTPDLMPGMLASDVLTPAGSAAGGSVAFNAVVAGVEASHGDMSQFDLSLGDVSFDMIQHTALPTPPSTKAFELATIFASKVQWSVNEIQRAPATLVLENKTPWSHPMLYRDSMPRSMQDAHASCALYMAKNHVNAPVIFRSIEHRVNDLLASPLPMTPRDCLAHTQALLLYQIIRLCDGDIAARASAERIQPALEASASALLAHVSFDIESSRELQIYPVGPTKDFWTEWLFQESCRRTLLATFYFVQAYRIMSGNKQLRCDNRIELCHAWTLSSYLWNASTPVAFADAWKNKKHFVVMNADYDEVIDRAMPEDVDSFGKIFISSLMGIEDAEGWFVSRGGKL